MGIVEEAIATLGQGLTLSKSQRNCLTKEVVRKVEGHSLNTFLDYVGHYGYLKREKLRDFLLRLKDNEKTITKKSIQEEGLQVVCNKTFCGVASVVALKVSRKMNNLDFQNIPSTLTKKIKRILEDHVVKYHTPHIKFGMTAKAILVKDGKFSEIHSGSNTNVSFQRVVNNADIIPQITAGFAKMQNDIETFEGKGSGQRLERIESIIIKIANYQPYTGSSYIPLPDWIQKKQCCINVRNEDNKCFLWSVLAGLYPQRKDANRVAKYKQYEHTLVWDKAELPMTSTNITKFEQLNKLQICVFGLENNHVIWEYEGLRESDAHLRKIHLLRFENNNKSHYAYIKNLTSLLKAQTGYGKNCKVCQDCLQPFATKEAWENHLRSGKCTVNCNGSVKVLPAKGDKNTVKFTNFKKQLWSPAIFYADIESLLVKMNHSKHFQAHKASHLDVLMVSQFPEKLPHEYKSFQGPDCVYKALEYMNTKRQEIERKLLTQHKPMVMTKKDKQDFQHATVCYLCKKPLRNKCRDHCHITGRYRGCACNNCNLNLNYRNQKTSVVFHNLKGYDGHFIIQEANKLYKPRISCIPSSMEKYISFSINQLQFIDSLQFTGTSLEALVNGLKQDNNNKQNFQLFYDFTKDFSRNTQDLLLQKGVFPYDWFDNLSKLQNTSLPSKHDFYSHLTATHITDEDYERANKVWKETSCQTFNDYLKLYLKTDVLLLACCFEAFRKLLFDTYHLDPAHYFTAAGLSWDCMLHYTQAFIQCFHEQQEDMLEVIQQGVRGGISMISKRYARANNKYMTDYNEDKPSSYLMYWDANNLYGEALSCFLPTGDYEWDSSWKDNSTEQIMELSASSPKGYIFEVDALVPKELHDKFSDYPLMVETTEGKASGYMQRVHQRFSLSDQQDIKYHKKLIPNLCHKTKYAIHYRNLQQCIEQGIVITRIHRVLKFSQAPFIRPYIENGIVQEFEKVFLPALDSFLSHRRVLFGKTIENVDKRVNVHLINDKKTFMKKSRSPLMKNFELLHNDLCAVEMKKTRVLYNKPIVIGFCVLELSKVRMYDFHYNYITETFPDANLLFTDTDSLCYELFTEDIYNDVRQEAHRFDFSNYPTCHRLYDNSNIAVGKFKDECQGKLMVEFVGLRPKMYSFITEDFQHKCTAKGVKKCTIQSFQHQAYKDCIFGQRTFTSFYSLVSLGHNVFTTEINKVALSSFDDKRWVLDDGIHTLAHGHYKII
jgi:hypothetical protein